MKQNMKQESHSDSLPHETVQRAEQTIHEIVGESINSFPYLTKIQAADFLQISTRTLDKWMRQRRVPYIRIGKTIRFRRSDLENNVGRFFEARDRS
jgi:excisionase family DNA binding protein